MTTTAATVRLDVDTHGHIDRRQALKAFADGHHIEQVFGPDRPIVAKSLVGHVQSIIPTKADMIRHAYGHGNERRIRAYRNGREYLRAAYYGYEGVENLPPLNSDDLPEDA